MAKNKKEGVISTGAVNYLGARVLTAGIDLEQYRKNPVLLYMHIRADEKMLPIGRIENIRVEGDRLIGLPVFDEQDEFAQKVALKWESGFLKMLSPWLQIIETSDDPASLLQGQTRPTITKSKLIEVSIVDIGGNDDALQLVFERDGKMIQLAAGDNNDNLPLLNNPSNFNQMKQIFLALGLPETATSNQAVAAIEVMKAKADKVDAIQLSAIEAAVDGAIGTGRVTADKRNHFISLGKTAGIASLNETLSLFHTPTKPSGIINQGNKPETAALKWGDLSPEQAEKMKAENAVEYARLYREEFGVELGV